MDDLTKERLDEIERIVTWGERFTTLAFPVEDLCALVRRARLVETYERALRSIARNTRCNTRQEAARVAQSALNATQPAEQEPDHG